MSKLSDTRSELMDKFGTCEREEVCQTQYSYDRCGPLEAHHGIFGRKKGHPEYDVVQNCCIMGKRCHLPRSYTFGTWLCEKRKSEGYNMSLWFKSLRHKTKNENYGQDD